MGYVINRNGENSKLCYYNVSISGLDVIPKNKVSGISIKASKMTIIDSDLASYYIKQRINKKINKLIEFMLKILYDDDTTDGDVGIVLDEINRLKGIIFNKYKEHMKVTEYKALLSKIIVIEEEFKKNYNRKLYLSRMDAKEFNQEYPYEEERSGGRSR